MARAVERSHPRALGTAWPAIACALSTACASAPERSYVDEPSRLVIGVDPEGEADSVTRQLEAHGYYEARRLRGRAFTALGFTPVRGDANAGRVRVVTARGIALALDSEAPTLLTKGHGVRLLDHPYQDTRDFDHDGREELFVREQPLPSGEPCLRVYEVADDGAVEEKTGEGLVLPRPADSRDPGYEASTFCANEGKKESGSESGSGSKSGSESGSTSAP